MEDEAIQLDTTIRFLVSVPDWRPEDATPLQGFAFSLCENSRLLRFITQMPTDIFEFTPDNLSVLIARRIAGQSPISWYGQSPRAIQSMPIPVEAPFTVIVLSRRENVEDYSEWLATCPGPVTIIAEKGGSIPYDKLSFGALRDRFLEICIELRRLGGIAGLDEVESAIKSWTIPPEKRVTHAIKGHGTITPNLAALRACGYYHLGAERFDRIDDGEQPYTDQIVMTTNMVLDEREAHPASVANQIYPRCPDLNLYLPATYDLHSAVKFNRECDAATLRSMEATIRVLDRQSSYNFGLTTSSQIKGIMGVHPDELKSGAEPSPNPMMRLRQSEVWFGTEAVACLAASEISAVVRLPNRLNRSRGVVRQFAQHYRADKPHTHPH
jgi:hypothetical protein